ncbi:MAG: STAS domain-containing protein [Planctomycetales bacterium]|nr:STAS domain-containing protein [Planctomycetales bacterium]
MAETVLHQLVAGTLVVRILNKKFDYEEGEKLVNIVYRDPAHGSNVRNIVLNLEGVDQVRSAGLSVIGRLGLDYQLKVVCPSPDVKKVLNMMGFLPLLKIYYTEKEALQET